MTTFSNPTDLTILAGDPMQKVSNDSILEFKKKNVILATVGVALFYDTSPQNE